MELCYLEGQRQIAYPYCGHLRPRPPAGAPPSLDAELLLHLSRPAPGQWRRYAPLSESQRVRRPPLASLRSRRFSRHKASFVSHIRTPCFHGRPFASLQLGLMATTIQNQNGFEPSDCRCVLGTGLCSARASCKEPNCWNTFSRDDVIERASASNREATCCLHPIQMERGRQSQLLGTLETSHSSLLCVETARPGPLRERREVGAAT